AALKWIQTNKRKFDVIFLDPPFDQVNYESLLSAIRTQDLLAANGKIYLETDKRTEILLSKKQEVLKDKTIGDVRLMILQ
ncbi:RsmD family RNA methyltransferase, partial [Gammaproteobacteria bacterium]|nr:RsmD family RNA methyltransferase [Gammaproteobacteria bacterium]